MQPIHHVINPMASSTVLYPRLFILLAIFLIGTPAFGQSRSGTTAATFLTLGAGARGSSVGQAYTAQATGVDALFWNPGAAAIAYDGQLRGGAFFSQYDWFAGIDYNAAGLVVPINLAGVLGLSVAAVNYGEMDVRTVEQPEGNGEVFSANDLSVGLTYSQPLTPEFAFGGTVKYVQQSIWDMRANTFAFDLGFVLQTRYLQGMRVAASIMNFGGKMQMDGVNSDVFIDLDPQNSGSNPDIPARLKTDRWDLPISFKFGVAVPVVSLSYAELLFLADSHQTNDNNLNADIGGMLNIRAQTLTFSLRGGYRDLFLEDVDNHLSLGAGLDLRVYGVRFGFDYAYLPFDRLDAAQLVDFRVYF